MGFFDGSAGKESACHCSRRRRLGLNPWVENIPRRRRWQPHCSILAWKKKPHEQRNLVGYSLKSCRVRHDWGAPEHTEHNNQIDNNNNSSNDNNRMLVLSTYCVPDSVLWTLTELSQWQGRKCHFYLVDEENVMRDISRVSWHPSQDVAVKIQGQNKQTNKTTTKQSKKIQGQVSKALQPEQPWPFCLLPDFLPLVVPQPSLSSQPLSLGRFRIPEPTFLYLSGSEGDFSPLSLKKKKLGNLE